MYWHIFKVFFSFQSHLQKGFTYILEISRRDEIRVCTWAYQQFYLFPAQKADSIGDKAVHITGKNLKSLPANLFSEHCMVEKDVSLYFIGVNMN